MKNFIDLHKTRGYQLCPIQIYSLSRQNYLLLSNMQSSLRTFHCLKKTSQKTGRQPISRNFMFRGLIYKSLRRFPYLTDLSFELNNNPIVSKALGFNPMKPAPSRERFSSFLHDTVHQELISIRQPLMQKLISLRAVSGNSISMNSCPIVALLKENNLKTSIADRFDKTKRPAGDPDARS